jgi:hypothetical protein
VVFPASPQPIPALSHLLPSGKYHMQPPHKDGPRSCFLLSCFPGYAGNMVSMRISFSKCRLRPSGKWIRISEPLNEPSPSILKLHRSYSPIWPAPDSNNASLTFDACSSGTNTTSFLRIPSFRASISGDLSTGVYSDILLFTPPHTLSIFVWAAYREILLRIALIIIRSVGI